MQSLQVDENPTNAELLSAIQGFANYVETNMVTKVEFKEVKQDVAELKENVGMLTQDVEELKQKADNTTTILDGISKNVSAVQQDHVAAIAWLQRHDKNFEAHDKIIGHNCNFELAVV